jgi:hypothetical protein
MAAARSHRAAAHDRKPPERLNPFAADHSQIDPSKLKNPHANIKKTTIAAKMINPQGVFFFGAPVGIDGAP